MSREFKNRPQHLSTKWWDLVKSALLHSNTEGCFGMWKVKDGIKHKEIKSGYYNNG